MLVTFKSCQYWSLSPQEHAKKLIYVVYCVFVTIRKHAFYSKIKMGKCDSSFFQTK